MEDVHKPQMGFLIESPNTGQQYYRKYFFHSDHRYGSENFFGFELFKFELSNNPYIHFRDFAFPLDLYPFSPKISREYQMSIK